MLKSLKVIRNKTGASMAFVLAVMLLLMAISTSALVAASANAGTGINKEVTNQLYLYSDSIHKAIMHSLQTSINDQGTDINSAATLGGQILKLMYNESLEADTYSVDDDIILDITPNLHDGTDYTDLTYVENITIKITPSVIITPFIPKQEELRDIDGNILIPSIERQPQTAVISGAATVTVDVSHKGKSIISVITYGFSGGFLEDNGHDDSIMLIKNAGEWSFVSYDKIDRYNKNNSDE